MDLFQHAVITDIQKPLTVFSQKGRQVEMKNRSHYGLSFCIDGQITYTMNGIHYISDKNHAILLPLGGNYTLYGDSQGMFPVLNFQCLGLDCDEIRVFALCDPEECIRDYERILHLFVTHGSHPMIYSLFYQLLHKVSQDPPGQKSLLSPAIRYLDDHLSDPSLSNALLAQQAGISEVYFRKQFLAEYGVTPKQYILDARIRHAKQLLTDTALSVTAIAEQSGFSSVYHFCRIFKERTGTTPMHYAKSNKIFSI